AAIIANGTRLTSEVILKTRPAIAIPRPPYFQGSRLTRLIAMLATTMPVIAPTPNRPRVTKLMIPRLSAAIAIPLFWPSRWVFSMILSSRVLGVRQGKERSIIVLTCSSGGQQKLKYFTQGAKKDARPQRNLRGLASLFAPFA